MEQRRIPVYGRTFKYLRRSVSNLSLNFNESKDDGKVIVIDDAALAERFQNQYIKLLELETQQGRRLNEELFFKFLSQEDISNKKPLKKIPKTLKFLRLFRCSAPKTKIPKPTETCLVECQCCYDQIDLTKSAMCDNDHIFCHSCIVKGTDLAISNGASFVRCFAECNEEISLPTLQSVVPRKTYEILVKKRQEEEVAAARLDFLECCPFCPYQMELDVDVVTFYCQNPDCMKISCRSCKKIYHYDVKCEDVIDEHKGRLFVEEEMSEALIRKCYNCKKPFVLWDGCNKIQCSCGATMCYRCRQPITGYSHFDQSGGCQLHEDTETIDKIQVERRRDKAISKLQKDFPGLKIPKI